MEKIIKGKDVALSILEDINKMKKQVGDIKPAMAIVRIGENGDDITYERSIIKKFETLDIQTHSYAFELSIDNDVFLEKLKEINDDENIHGIIVLRPLPQHINIDKVASIINPKKDIDGLTHINISRLFSQDDRGFVTCTPQSIMEVIDYLKVDLTGKKVTIVGAGMAVGRPLSVLFLNQGATVTICSIHTTNLKLECHKSDIIIAAAGVKHLIKKEFVKEDSIVIDVGINVEDGKIYGDVDFENVLPLCKYITPVPGGVGSITTTILAKQLYKAILLQKK